LLAVGIGDYVIIFQDGIILLANEEACLLHMVPDAEAWLTWMIAEKVRARRDALIEEWRPRLFADPAVTELPADAEELCILIMARDDYQTRVQRDAEQNPPANIYNYNISDFESISRVASDATVTLFPTGIYLADTDADCVLAYVRDIKDWILGALMGQVNRGRKKMIKEYHPVILADPSVATMPSNEYQLIDMIVARSDYRPFFRLEPAL
jgi:hypothetical protein